MEKINFYGKEFPNVGDIVVIKVVRADEVFYEVELLEYGGIIGNMMMADVSRRLTSKVTRGMRIGKQMVVEVTAVDLVKKYIDVSKKHVDADDVEAAMDKYKKAQVVNSIVYASYDGDSAGINVAMRDIVWPLYANYDHAIDGFTAAVDDDSVISCNLLRAEIIKRLEKRVEKYVGIIMLICFTGGVDSIIAVLRGIKNEYNAEVTYLGNSQYRIVCADNAEFDEICKTIGIEIGKCGGKMAVADSQE